VAWITERKNVLMDFSFADASGLGRISQSTNRAALASLPLALVLYALAL
jgi:hypothetical protein